MNGIEKITQRIAGEAQAEAEAILAQARAQAQTVADQAADQARKETAGILAAGEAQAGAYARRVASMAQLEGRKRLLGAKQESITMAFDKALEKLLTLPEEEYVDLLARLAASAAVTGREKVLLNDHDQKKIGKTVVAKANELLAKAVAPKLPEELAESKAGAILDKVVAAGSALLAGTGMLTLGEETRPICGGFILESEGVELNCAFETLVRLSRPELERQVADVLFGQ